MNIQTLQDLHNILNAKPLEEAFVLQGHLLIEPSSTKNRLSLVQFQPEHECLAKELPAVISLKKVQEVLPRVSLILAAYLPPSTEAICDECGEGWTLANVHDAVNVRGQFKHCLCQSFVVDRKNLNEFTLAVRQAGLGHMMMNPIPNEYWTSGSPWFLLMTPKGNIKFGWRKHVISLSWEGLVEHALGSNNCSPFHYSEAGEARFSNLFPKDPNTQGSNYIHVYSYEKLTEYLGVLAKVANLRCSLDSNQK
jgi:hypothetical protein